MEISSVSNASFSRSVTPSKSSSDRQSNEQTQAILVEAKAQERLEHERAVQEKLQHSQDDNQRRLDGRLVSFGYEQRDDAHNQSNQAAYTRSRVNEAYRGVNNESVDSYRENSERSETHRVEPIDIVV